MSSPTPPNAKAKSSRFEKHFRVGDFLLMEGDDKQEMHIIRKGKVSILQREGEQTVKIATLGPGSVLGELSLLGKATSPVTVEAADEVLTTTIDKSLLDQTLSKVPNWLKQVFSVVVNRLMDTQKRTQADILRRSVPAYLKALLYHIKSHNIPHNEGIYVPLHKVQESAIAMFGLSYRELYMIENFFLKLDLFNIILHKEHKKVIQITDPSIIRFYYEHLMTLWQGEKPNIYKTSSASQILAEVIFEAAETRGMKHMHGRALDLQQLQLHLEQLGFKDIEMDYTLLSELKSIDMIQIKESNTQTHGGTYYRKIITFSPPELTNFIKLAQWVELFDMDIAEHLQTSL